jgi:hypothetical protein
LSHARILVGALAVLVLLFIAPVVGVIALAVFLIAGIGMWVVEGRGSRQCPRCGEHVPNGVLDCEHCGFDFRTIGAEND